MSNALAIASVTRVLKDLLNNGLIDNDVSGAVGGNVIVTALPPDRINIDADAAQTSQLNLFMHQVSPNLGWRNTDLPTRDGRGQRTGNPLLPLDLHYLLTAYGAEELHSEILLGYAMLLLHENAILSREAIRKALAGAAVNAGILPPAFRAVAASELADQVEQIKIIPENFGADEMSKLWTAFQTHYRPSAAYQVSVVLIEGRGVTRRPLPVLTRGEPDPTTGRDAGVSVEPDLLPPYPTLEAMEFPNGQVAACMGDILTFKGHHLAGDQLFVRFTEPRSGRSLQLEAMPGATATVLQVRLPPDPPEGPVAEDAAENPENWRAGAYAVTVLMRRAGAPDRTANGLAVTVAPRIDSIAHDAAAGTIEVECSPPVASAQRVSLIVGDHEIEALEIAAGATRNLSFAVPDPVPGEYWVRLRVDGAESLLIDRSTAPPSFDATQKVVIA